MSVEIYSKKTPVYKHGHTHAHLHVSTHTHTNTTPIEERAQWNRLPYQVSLCN